MTTTLPFYRATKSGHFPTDIRDAFLEAVDAFEEWDGRAPEPTIEVRHRQLSISGVCDLVRGCHDLLPTATCTLLRIERFDSYATGAEALAVMIAGGQRRTGT